MRVVRFHHQIGNGQFQLMRIQASGFAVRHQRVARTEPEQDFRGLRDDQAPRFQKRRRKRPRTWPLAAQERQDGVVALLACDVGVIRAGVFQRQAHEFAAALDAGPVIELIAHGVLLRGTADARRARLNAA